MSSAQRHGRKMKVRRSGRHTTPSQMEKVTDAAGKAAPAMAVAGIMVTAAPHHGFAPAKQKAAAEQSVQHARLDSQVSRSQSSNTYSVQSGDTLGAIAQRFGSSWQSLYHANEQLVHNPNMIFPGQSLNIPGGSSASTASSYQPQHAASTDDDAQSGSASGSASAASASSGGSSSAAAASSGGSYSGTLGCSQLEGLWEAAGGSSGTAAMAASIAEAESSGNQFATGPNGEKGYWQIMPNNPMSTYDPMGNAKAAISMSSDGSNWSAWSTYSNGMYQGKC